MRRFVAVVVIGAVLVLAAVVAVRMGRGAEPGVAGRVQPVDGVVAREVGVVVALPSSGWEPGDDAMEALLGGVVRVRADGCVVAGPPEPRPVVYGEALLWPAGWSARRDASGRVEILDPDGDVALREGDGFEVGGGSGGKGVDWACGRATDGGFVMNDIPRRAPAPAPDPTPGPGTPVPVPTSGWTPDQPQMTDLFTGRLLASEGNCVFGRPAAPARAKERTALVWPARWTAQRSVSDGRVEILDESGRVRLREGDLMTLGGGLRPYAAAANSTCRPGEGEAFFVHRGVSVAKRGSAGFRG